MPATIVHVITQLELGGAQEITLFMCRHLDRRRFRVHLVTGEPGILDDDARSIPDLGFHRCDDLVREVRPGSDLRGFRSLTTLLRRIAGESDGPTLVHTHSSKAGILGRWAAWAARIPVRVHSIHGFGFHPHQSGTVRRLFQAAERWTARITHGFTADSAANLETARSLGLLDGGKPGVVLPCWIETGDYRPRSENDRLRLREELTLAPETPLVGMLACLKPQKAPVDFVRVAGRVAATHPQAHFFLAGDGVLRPQVESEIERLGLGGRFHLLGWRRDVRELLAAADVVVLTSLWEGLPRTVPQAMAAGRPVVATRVDGTPEAVRDGATGFLLEPHDVPGFADRIGRLLAEPDTARAMGEKGARLADEFDAHRMLERLEALYDRLLAGAGAPA